MRGKAHPEHIRLECITALLAGEGPTEVARRYGIPASAVKNWKRELSGRRVSLTKPDDGDEIGELITRYLRANLIALRIHAEMFQDRAWLAEHGPRELAIVHSVLMDKAVRILEAAAAAERYRGDRWREHADYPALPAPVGEPGAAEL